jgi:hypothetical protein
MFIHLYDFEDTSSKRIRIAGLVSIFTKGISTFESINKKYKLIEKSI